MAMRGLSKKMFVKWLGPAKHRFEREEDSKMEIMAFEDVFGCKSTAPYHQVRPPYIYIACLWRSSLSKV